MINCILALMIIFVIASLIFPTPINEGVAGIISALYLLPVLAALLIIMPFALLISKIRDLL